MVVKLIENLAKSAKIFTAIIVVVMSCAATSAMGQVLEYKVQTRMVYSEDTNQGVRRELIHQFKKDALKSLMADPLTPEARARLIEQNFEEMTDYETIDKFFTKFQFREACDTRTGSECGQVQDNALILQGIASVSINAINNFLQSKSAAASGAQASEFGTFFTARKVSSRKVFDEKKKKIQARESTSSTEVVAGGDDTSSVSGGSEQTMSVQTTGGSRELKVDAFEYAIDISLTRQLGSAINSSLSNANYEAFDFEEILYEEGEDGLEEMIENGKIGPDGTVANKSIALMKRLAKDFDITFLGIGNVNLGLGEPNSVNNDMRVPATVTMEVFMKKDGRRGMPSVASVPATTFYWNYPVDGDYTVALTNAINFAAKRAMETIVSQLQLKGFY
jgi:hypothetical protein